jgi:hypothetical protein
MLHVHGKEIYHCRILWSSDGLLFASWRYMLRSQTKIMLSKNTAVFDGSFVHLFNYPGIFCDGPKETVYMKLVTIVASRLRSELYIIIIMFRKD